MPDLNWLDILVLLLLAVSAIAGFFKGLARELISLGSLMAGFILALLFYPYGARLLQPLGIDAVASGLLGFLAIFLLSIIGGALLIRVIHSALKIMHLRWVDRMLGGLFGLVRGGLINAIIFLVLAAFPISGEFLAKSKTAEFFLTTTGLLLTFSSSDLKQRFESGYERIYRIWLKETLEDGGSD